MASSGSHGKHAKPSSSPQNTPAYPSAEDARLPREAQPARQAAPGAQPNTRPAPQVQPGTRPAAQVQPGTRPAPQARPQQAAPRANQDRTSRSSGYSTPAYPGSAPAGTRPPQAQPAARPGAYQQPRQGAGGYAPGGYIPRGYPANLSPDAQRYSRTNYDLPRKRPSRLRKVLAVLLILLVLFGAFMGITGKFAYDDMRSIMSHGKVLAGELTSGDPSKAAEEALRVQDAASHMHGLTGNPVWAVASFIPVVGADVAAARTYAEVVDELSSELIVPLAQNIQQAGTGPFIREDSSFNADSLRIAFDALASAQAAVDDSRVKSLSLRRPFIGKIASVHKMAYKGLDALHVLAAASPELSGSIHFLLGADGAPRTYLVIAQNNSEVRSTGGFIGSYGYMTVNNGLIDMGDFSSIWNMGRYGGRDNLFIGMGEPEITGEEAMLFGRRVAMTPGDTTIIPHFPRVANLLQQDTAGLAGIAVDGVVSVDPIFLQGMLGATGGVSTADGGDIDGTNAATILLRDIYWTREGEAQDAFFSEVANLAFHSLFDNIRSVKPAKMLGALWDASGSRNLQAFFNNELAETAMSKLGYAGEVTTDPTKSVLGIYLDNGAGSKMSWYLSQKTAIGNPINNEDGSATWPAKTIVRNNATTEDMQTLPSYVSGTVTAETGRARHYVYLFAPAGGRIANLNAQTTGKFYGRPAPEYYAQGSIDGFIEGSYNGIDVWYCIVDLGAGEDLTITYDVISSPSTSGTLSIDATPTVQRIAGWN